jgi:hypothetical protein
MAETLKHQTWIIYGFYSDHAWKGYWVSRSSVGEHGFFIAKKFLLGTGGYIAWKFQDSAERNIVHTSINAETSKAKLF